MAKIVDVSCCAPVTLIPIVVLFDIAAMLNSILATVQDGQIHLAENVTLPEGTKLLVTILAEDERQFWQQASQTSLAAVWDNAEDDVYAQLLEE